MKKPHNNLFGNLKQIGNEGKKDDLDIKKYFCNICLQYPEYIIKIKNNGDIYLSHICLKNNLIDIDFKEIKDYEPNILDKTCVYCKRNSSNICLKCEAFICDNCAHEHESYNDFINSDGSQQSIFPIFDSQYFCKDHLNKVTHFCPFCKINLCEKECLLEHCHSKIESLEIEINTKPSGYKGKNQTLKNLSDLAKSFYEIYNIGLKNEEMTCNIILNTHLIQSINKFINENINIKGKIKAAEINNKLKRDNEEKYLFSQYGSDDFNRYYYKLFIGIGQGNIKYFHKLLEIKTKYENLNRFKKDNIYLKHNYLIRLSSLLDNNLDQLFLFRNLNEFRDLPLLVLELKQKINILENIQNNLELDLQLLKKLVKSINFRVDYELRRKIGNLIADKFINLYGEKIDKIHITEYLLSLSIEDLEEKIVKSDKMKNSDKKATVQKALNQKYRNALKLLNDKTSKKLNNKNINNVKFPIKTVDIKFNSKNISQKTIREDTLLNLFFIIRKKLGDVFNKSIHNEPVKLNYLVKEELEKNKSEKEVSKDEKKEIFKKEEEQFKNEIVDSENDDEFQDKIEDSNEIKLKLEEIKINKTCKNIKTLFIRNNIKIKSNKVEQWENDINNIIIDKKNSDIQSSLLEFYQCIKEKESQV